MLIQIYEVTNPTEARALAALGVDHLGVLIGRGRFPRELDFNRACEIFASLPKGKKGVALSLAPTMAEIIEVADRTKPDILHIGTVPENISPDDLLLLKNRFPALPIMRSIPVIDAGSIRVAESYEEIADWLLLDTYRKGDAQIGAVGKVHDWQLSRAIAATVKVPVILAGGLGPDNIATAIKIVNPAGVDSKTKTDKADGTGKDLDKVRAFVNAARSLMQ